MQVHSEGTDRAMETIELRVDDPDLDFEGAKGLARQAAHKTGQDAMLLSWHSLKTGEFYPKYDCGPGTEAPWAVYAKARGANLTVRINDGAFTFLYLLL